MDFSVLLLLLLLLLLLVLLFYYFFLIQLNFITIVGPWRLHQWLKEHFKSIGRNLPIR